MRVFVAIGLPDEVKDVLMAVQSELRVDRLVDPDSMHVTLAFLDDQPLTMIEAVHEALGEISVAPFEMTIRGVDVFGGNSPRLVFAGIEPSEALSGLRRKIRTAVQGAGVQLKHTRFRPHVTLARISKDRQQDIGPRLGRFLEMHAGLTLGPVKVEAFGLYQSHLAPEGASYEVLVDYPLGQE